MQQGAPLRGREHKGRKEGRMEGRMEGVGDTYRLQASLLCASTPCPYLYIVSREVALWRGAWCSLLETSRKKKESAALE